MMLRMFFLKLGRNSGDEAAIFGGDLHKMYTKFSEKQSWNIEMLSQTRASWWL